MLAGVRHDVDCRMDKLKSGAIIFKSLKIIRFSFLAFANNYEKGFWAKAFACSPIT